MDFLSSWPLYAHRITGSTKPYRSGMRPFVQASGADYIGKTRYYDIEYRTSMTTGSWQLVPGSSGIMGDGSVIAYTNTTPDQSEYYRARTRLQ
jgi:hypothetical protein